MSTEFAADYRRARNSFCRLASVAGAEQDEIRINAFGPQGELLTINTARLGARHAPHLIIHLSGVHGVEGFAGSAVQCDWLANLPKLSDRHAIIFIHIVNPFGMAWLRRVNENNVDLNRNCIAPGETYAGAPLDYIELNNFLNPASPISFFDNFYPKTAWCIARYGFERLSQSIAGGQYEFPQGLFYGGLQLEQGPQLVLDWLRDQIADAETISTIDLHTGLGKYGNDLFLSPHPISSEKGVQLRKLFGKKVRGPKGTGYRAHGTLYEAIERMADPRPVNSICHEFGTYNSVKVLRNLRAENRLWWTGAREELTHPVKQAFREAFIPGDVRWRNKVLKYGRKLVDKVLGL